MQDNDTLITDSLGILLQGIELIERLDDTLYRRPHHPSVPYGVGSHFRHCIDFYNGFLQSLTAGRINYDERERDERLANDRALAIATMRDIMRRLERFSPADYGREVEVISEDSRAPQQASRSTVMRELQFLLSHTIHHYALIALALGFQGIEVTPPFGVAISTLKHWEKEGAAYPEPVTG